MKHPSTASLAITNGIIVNDSWSGPATVLIKGSVIVGIADAAEPVPAGFTVLDADGSLVLPGAVDPHCHVKSVAGEYSTLDGYAEASEAALWGGTTTLVDFAIPEPGEKPVDAAKRKIQIAEQSHCDVSLHGCVTEWWDDLADQLVQLHSIGIPTIKLFTTYRHTLMAAPRTQQVVLQALKSLGGLAYVHAESNALIEAVHEELTEPDAFAACHHPRTRPELTEAAAVAEVLALAELVDAPVYFVHQTTAAAVEAVQAARRRGMTVFAETCPHYLVLDESVYEGEHPEYFVCCPPMRPRVTVESLRERVLAGDVDTIGSDHNCYSTEQKIRGRADVRTMPNGLPGVELRLPVLYSTLVASGSLSPQSLVRMVCSNPARLAGLYPRKGVLAPGADADIVILDSNSYRSVQATDLHMATDYSPYEGFELTGWPRIVLQRGQVVVDEHGFHPSRASGHYIKGGRIDFSTTA